MISMNKTFLVGNLVRDVSMHYTNTGTPIAEFRMAITDNYVTGTGEKKASTCFINVIAWRRLAESCGNYLVKGSPVFVEGRLEQNDWVTPDGERRSQIRVVAYSVQFIRRETLRTESGRQIGINEGPGETVTDSSASGRLAPPPDDGDGKESGFLDASDLEDLG